MKFKLLLLASIVASINADAQSNNNISLLYGISTTNVDIHNAIGDFGYNQKTGIVQGITYSRKINKWFSIETGLLVENDKVELSTILPGMGTPTVDGIVKLISVPVYAKFTFLRYFYGDTGISFDYQTNYSSNSVVNSESGTGVELGIGAKYTLGRIIIFVNPYTHIYTLNTSHFNLMEAGYKFGAGYDF